MEDKTKLKHYWLYVLELEDQCYYVGITAKTPEERFKQHLNDFSAADWTKLHKPLRIHDKKDLGFTSYEKAEGFEKKAVRKYVRAYGLDKVRGGDLSQTGKFVILFGYPIYWENLKMALGILFMMAVILYLSTKAL